MSNLPAAEFRTYTDSDLRERIERSRSLSGVVAHVERFRMLRELAIRKSLRLEGKRVLIKAEK